MQDIENAVLELLVDICASKKVRRDLDMDLFNGGYIDSMRVVELLTELEEVFNVEIPLNTFNPDEFRTANKIIKFVKENINN